MDLLMLEEQTAQKARVEGELRSGELGGEGRGGVAGRGMADIDGYDFLVFRWPSSFSSSSESDSPDDEDRLGSYSEWRLFRM